MGVSGQISPVNRGGPNGIETIPITLQSRSLVCIADIEGTAANATQALNPTNLYAETSVEDSAVINMNVATRVRFAARIPSTWTAVATSPVIRVWAIEADSHDAGVFTNVRSIEDLGSVTLTCEASPAASNMPTFGTTRITAFSSDLDPKGRRFVLPILETAASKTGTGTGDIVAEIIN